MPHIVSIIGYKSSGKDTMCRLLAQELHKVAAPGVIDIEHQYFAEPLKDCCWAMFGQYMDSKDQVWGDDAAKSRPIPVLPISAEHRARHEFLRKHEFWSGRLLLQWLGTEVFRSVRPSIWLDIMVSKLNKSQSHFVIITDSRFLNEQAALCDFAAGSITTIRMERPGCVSDGHASEREIGLIASDFTINNSGPLKYLEDQAAFLARSLWARS